MLFRTTVETVRLWPIRSEHKTEEKCKDFHDVNDNRKANQSILDGSGVPGPAGGEGTASALAEHSHVPWTQLRKQHL